jgi:ribonuclease Z
MDCFVLGSGGMMPMPRRRLASVALRVSGQIYLFDCGEGTQVPYKELHLGLRALRLVAVTHLHADHCLGLPGLLMLRAQMPDPEPLTVLGPPGLARFIDHVREDLALFINFEIAVREWAPDSEGEAYRDEHVRLLWEPLQHTVLCLGYRLEEHDRPGRFDPEAARRLGVPEGPLWGQLQRGQSVQTAAGTAVEPRQVIGPPRRGRRVAYTTDTTETPALPRLLRDVDLAFLESMFLEEHAEEARTKQHLTAEQAGRAAHDAGARQVVLIHLSPRYEERDLPRFALEAGRHHGSVEVARDGMVLQLPLPD